MSPERVRHAESNCAVQSALAAAIRSAGVPCRKLPHGMTVHIDAGTIREPDALVYCGERLDSDAVEVREPVIVVEILVPSTKAIDTSIKLAGDFRGPSVRHYLIVDPGKPMVISSGSAMDAKTVLRVSPRRLGRGPRESAGELAGPLREAGPGGAAPTFGFAAASPRGGGEARPCKSCGRNEAIRDTAFRNGCARGLLRRRSQ